MSSVIWRVSKGYNLIDYNEVNAKFVFKLDNDVSFTVLVKPEYAEDIEEYMTPYEVCKVLIGYLEKYIYHSDYSTLLKILPYLEETHLSDKKEILNNKLQVLLKEVNEVKQLLEEL